MQSLDVFMSRLIPLMPGCPHPMAQQALLDAATEFSDETVVVQYATEPLTLVEGQALYDLDIPHQTEVSRVICAWSGTRRLNLVAPPGVDSPLAYYNPIAGDTAPTGSPTVALVVEPNTITLYPTPDAHAAQSERLTVRAALRPAITATQLDDTLYRRWCEAVVAGAAFRLASRPGNSFSDDKLAQLSFKRYWHFINRARIEANRGTLAGPLRVRNTPFT